MDINKIAFFKNKNLKIDSQKDAVCDCESFNKVLKEQQAIQTQDNKIKEEPPLLKYAVPPYYNDYNIISKPTLKYAVPHFPRKNNYDDIPVAKYAVPNIEDIIEKYAIPNIEEPETLDTTPTKEDTPPMPLYAIPDDNASK